MKKYVIGAVVAMIIMAASFIYKYEKSRPDTPTQGLFPISQEERQRAKADVPMFLYVFLSQHNCHDCLQIIDTLNSLPPYFVVTGIAPYKELQNEKEFRAITGAAFPLVPVTKYKKFTPWYAPSIVGVSPYGDILFVLPGVPGEKDYLLQFLLNMYGKIYPVFYEQMANDKTLKNR
jgi:hypothetical protein